MYRWSDEQLMLRDAVRRFIDAEIKPNIEELEHGDTPPYDVLRKLFSTFGMDQMARDRFKRQIEFERAVAEATAKGETPPERRDASQLRVVWASLLRAQRLLGRRCGEAHPRHPLDRHTRLGTNDGTQCPALDLPCLLLG